MTDHLSSTYKAADIAPEIFISKKNDTVFIVIYFSTQVAHV